MRKVFKKILSVALILLMMLTSIPLCNFDIAIKAEATEYKVGDIIQFGSYPQSQVDNFAITAVLNALAPEWEDWTSYGYYSGDGNTGSMVQGNWMRYTDVTYNGNKYRGVKFTQYRPTNTYSSSSNNTLQEDNGYITNTVYWFKFESIDWRVLDPGIGLVMCETIIDSQPYSNTIYYDSSVNDSAYACFNDDSYKNYASDYETSSIRQWLNNDFYNTAFTDSEKKEISTTILNNDSDNTSNGITGYEKLDSNETKDKIFLLSYNEVRNSDFGFNSSSSAYDAARFGKGSDYAQSQGLIHNNLSSPYTNNSYWLLRSPGVSASSCCFVGSDGSSDEYFIVTRSFLGIRPALRFKDISKLDGATAKIKSEWFEKSSEEYNHKLAQACADYLRLGYSYNKEELEAYLIRTGFDIAVADMNTKRDEVNYFIASKDITVNSETKTLVFAGFIGTDKKQWYSNFDPLGFDRKSGYADDTDKYKYHIGFADARDFVYEKLKEFIDQHNINKNDMKLLLTGHSRGAATANLLAAKLIDEAEPYYTGEAIADNIYTYTFATPNTVQRKYNIGAEKYRRIFNIVNPEDFVTKVMVTSWHYGRYGTTYTLPSKTNDTENYSKYLKSMRVLFSEYTNGELYDPYKKGEKKTYKMIKNFGEEVETVDEFYSDKFLYSGSIIEASVDKKTPFEFFKNTLLKFLASKDIDAHAEAEAVEEMKRIVLYISGTFYKSVVAYFAWPDINSGKVIEAFASDTKLKDGVELGGKFNHAHRMETYCAYVCSMTSDELTAHRKSYKGTINCPVDVEVYDKETGDLVGRIVNNVVDEEIESQENSIVMDVEGDSKSFWLPSNGDYEIKLIGNDKGTMDYTMSEIDSDIGEVKRVNFFDVEITDGLTMTADIISDEFSVEEHTLTFEDGEELEPTEVFDDEDITEYSIEITTTKGGFANSSKKVKTGDYVSLTATANEGWKFIGWYENNILVSSENDLAFVAKNNRSLEVRFEHNDHKFGEWNTDTPATCETAGKEQRNCSECDYVETQEISPTGHSFADGQSKCSNCDFDKAGDCSCRCHSDSFFAKLIWKITIFFQKIFKKNATCDCGVAHY